MKTKRTIVVKVKVKEEVEDIPQVKEEPPDDIVKLEENDTDDTAPESIPTKDVDRSNWHPRRKYATREERLKANAEAKRRKRAKMTEAEREEYLRKQREMRMKQLKQMTEKEREERKRKNNEARKRQRERLTEEQKAEMRRKDRETARKRYQHITSFNAVTPEQREAFQQKNRELARNYFRNLTGEKLERRRQQLKMNKILRLARMTEEEKEELRKKHRESSKYHQQKMTKEQKEKQNRHNYFRIQAKLAEMTKEEREEWTRKNTEYARNWRENLTGERLERYKEYVRKKGREQLRNKCKSSKEYQRFLEYQRLRTAIETPEERQKRLRKCKINTAVRKLKKELEKAGVSQEEINEKAGELKAKMQAEPLPPPEQLSAYKPRLKSKPGNTGGQEQTVPEFHFRKPRRRLKESSRLPSVSLPLPVSGESTEAEPNVGTVNRQETVTSASLEASHNQTRPVPESNFRNLRSRRKENPDPRSGPSLLSASSEPAAEALLENETMATLNPNPLYTGTFVYSAETFQETEPAVDVDDNDRFDDFQDDPTNEGFVGVPLPCPTPVPEVERSASLASSDTSEDEVIQCPHCTSSYPQKSDLIVHFSSEHPKKCWKCPMCKQITLSPAELHEHFKSQHAPKLPPNPPVPAKISQSKANKSSGTFNCIKCDPSLVPPNSVKVFGTLKDLHEHVKFKHPASFWPCSLCGLLKYSERSLRIHEKVSHSKMNKKKL